VAEKSIRVRMYTFLELFLNLSDNASLHFHKIVVERRSTICEYRYTYTPAHKCAHIYTFAKSYTHVKRENDRERLSDIYVWWMLCICKYIYTYIYIYIYIYICIYIVRVRVMCVVYVCVYIFIYIYIYMNMYVRVRNNGGVFSFAHRAPSLPYCAASDTAFASYSSYFSFLFFS